MLASAARVMTSSNGHMSVTVGGNQTEEAWSRTPRVRSGGAQKSPPKGPTTLFGWGLINTPMADQIEGVRAQ